MQAIYHFTTWRNFPTHLMETLASSIEVINNNGALITGFMFDFCVWGLRGLWRCGPLIRTVHNDYVLS